jgi:hypothetical protein
MVALSDAQKRYRASSKGKASRKAGKARWHKTDAGKESKRRSAGTYGIHAKYHEHTFTGVDGEGYTDHGPHEFPGPGDDPLEERFDCTDECIHHYVCIIAGKKALHKKRPLTSLDCLAFLSSLPVVKDNHYVSFFFDYDTTMILRDMARDNPELTRRLFEVRKPGQLVWWRGYGIDYSPKKHLTVKKWTPDNSSKQVTIHDVQGYFQSSFVTAITNFNIGTEAQRAEIAAMKEQRAVFDPANIKAIIDYSKEECVLLAQLVSKLRDEMANANFNGYPYEGPGGLAGKALSRYYGKSRHLEVIQHVPGAVWDLALKAYYGGRFEILAHGPIPHPVHEYDLKSAYPAAMVSLPCFEHGSWTRKQLLGHLYISEISWSMPYMEHSVAGPFPVRRKDGSIYYPVNGNGWYWSHEIEMAKRIPGIDINVYGGWTFIPDCDCKPFAWVADLYDQRQELERERKGSGIAIKLMLNSLYGKEAQTRPVLGTFFNIIHAGLITSITRAKAYEVYVNHPGRVVMFATDAVFTLDRIPELDALDDGSLGSWEHAKTYEDMTIFQPGVYFDGNSAAFKTRGVPKKIFIEHAERLKAISIDFTESIPVKLQTHLGLRLALSRGTDTAMNQLGNWVTITKRMTAYPGRKRNPNLIRRDGVVWSKPLVNDNPHSATYPYNVLRSRLGNDQFRLDDDLISDGYYEGDFE